MKKYEARPYSGCINGDTIYFYDDDKNILCSFNKKESVAYALVLNKDNKFPVRFVIYSTNKIFIFGIVLNIYYVYDLKNRTLRKHLFDNGLDSNYFVISRVFNWNRTVIVFPTNYDGKIIYIDSCTEEIVDEYDICEIIRVKMHKASAGQDKLMSFENIYKSTINFALWNENIIGTFNLIEKKLLFSSIDCVEKIGTYFNNDDIQIITDNDSESLFVNNGLGWRCVYRGERKIKQAFSVIKPMSNGCFLIATRYGDKIIILDEMGEILKIIEVWKCIKKDGPSRILNVVEDLNDIILFPYDGDKFVTTINKNSFKTERYTLNYEVNDKVLSDVIDRYDEILDGIVYEGGYNLEDLLDYIVVKKR